MYQNNPKGIKRQPAAQVELLQNSMFERKTNPIQFEHEVRFFVLPFTNVASLLAGDTTPSVANLERLYSPSSATTVTDFTKGAEGQIITILGNGNLTVTNGTRIVTNTGANKVLEADQVYSFINLGDVWYEVGGSASANVTAGAPIDAFSVQAGAYFVSQSVNGIAIGEQIELEVWGTLYINTGVGPVTLTLHVELGAFTLAIQDTVTIADHASHQCPVHIKASFAVETTSSVGVVAKMHRGAPVASNSGVAAASHLMGWNTASNNLTGTQTLRARFTSDSAFNTQNFALFTYTIRKL